MLDAAKEDDSLKTLVQKNNSRSYLPRGATASDKYTDLGTKALEKAKAAIAQSLYKKDFDKLKPDEQQKVEAKAKKAVDEQKRLLTLNVRDTFKDDLVTLHQGRQQQRYRRRAGPGRVRCAGGVRLQRRPHRLQEIHSLEEDQREQIPHRGRQRTARRRWTRSRPSS